jgi:hypothetical protein
MLAIHCELRGFTGSLEMSVFHTLLAGNSGQLRAPGTVIPGGAAGGVLGDGDGDGETLTCTVLAPPAAAAAGLAAAACASALPCD